MGRELQKKKNRSSISKVRQKPKSKKINIKGNAIIAANWDSTQTLRQNYTRLGLASRLNASTGGIEQDPGDLGAESTNNEKFAIKSQNSNALIPSQAKIERGADGKIIRVIHDRVSKPNPLQDPLNDIASGSEDEDPISSVQPTDIVRRLEEQANNVAPKYPRKQSTREAEWVGQLVAKYGDDYKKMVRDRRLNPMQQSEGDLKRRVRKWKESNSRA